MTVRARENDDLVGLAMLLAAVHRHDGYPTYWPDDPERWLSPRSLLGAWVVDPGGGVAGHVALSALTAGHAAQMWQRTAGLRAVTAASVSRLFVAPGHRGEGHGRDLLDAASAEAARRRLRPVLDVVETGSEAIALYEQAGWRRVFSEPWREARGEPLRLYYYLGPE